MSCFSRWTVRPRSLHGARQLPALFDAMQNFQITHAPPIRRAPVTAGNLTASPASAWRRMAEVARGATGICGEVCPS